MEFELKNPKHPEGDVVLVLEEPSPMGMEPLDAPELQIVEEADEDTGELSEQSAPQSLMPGADKVVLEADEDDRDTDWENDGDHKHFLPYLRRKMSEIPRHKGSTTVGIERALSYLRDLDRQISKAIQTDKENCIDEGSAEDCRDQIYRDIMVLEEALDKLYLSKKKSKPSLKVADKIYGRIARDGEPRFYIKVEASDGESLLPATIEEPSDQVVTAYMQWERGELKKEASTKIMLTVDPFLNEVTHMMIRAHITYGRNLEEVYRFLAKKYDFTERDHLAVHGLLREKGLLLDKDFSRIDEDIMTGDHGITTKIYPA